MSIDIKVCVSSRQLTDLVMSLFPGDSSVTRGAKVEAVSLNKDLNVITLEFSLPEEEQK